MTTKQITVTLELDDAGNAQMACGRENITALEAISLLADAQKALVQQFVEAQAVKQAAQSRVQIARH